MYPAHREGWIKTPRRFDWLFKGPRVLSLRANHASRYETRPPVRASVLVKQAKGNVAAPASISVAGSLKDHGVSGRGDPRIDPMAAQSRESCEGRLNQQPARPAPPRDRSRRRWRWHMTTLDTLGTTSPAPGEVADASLAMADFDAKGGDYAMALDWLSVAAHHRELTPEYREKKAV